MGARAIAFLFAIIALAGCAKDAPAPAAPPDEVQLEFSSDTGVIRGIVIDPAIAPVPDVTVDVVGSKASTTSDGEGRFGFANMAPGTYFLEFKKYGFERVQQSVEVVAGVPSPPLVKVQMARLPGTEPFVVPMQWDGFMACSWFVGGVFATGCLIGEHIADDSRDFEMFDGVPAWLQTELEWEHTQPAGENLCLRQYASSSIGGDILGSVCGPSPLVMQVDGPALEQNGVGNTRGLERVVWVDFWLADGTVGVALDQGFTAFTHRFYNYAPDPAWLFIQDGPPVPPS